MPGLTVPEDIAREAVETAIRQNTPWSFAPALEARYEQQRGSGRRQRLAAALRAAGLAVLCGTILDAANGLNDLAVAACVRLLLAAVFAGAALGLTLLRRPWHEAVLVAIPCILMLAATEVLGCGSPPDFAVRYKLAAVVSVAAVLICSPVRLSTAAGVAAPCLVVYPLLLWLVPGPLPLSGNLDLPLFNLGAMAVAMLVVRSAEISRRRNYLNMLRYEMAARELLTLNKELSRLSRTDVLTGLANRRHFETEARRLWHDRRGDGIGVALIDVDWFKAFNDTAGHEAGDDCLRQVANGLAAAVREDADLVARYGGEEFVAMLSRARVSELAAVGERLRGSVESLGLAHPGRQGAPVTISVGMAWHGADMPGELDDLLRQADQALYAAKAAGRNGVALAREGAFQFGGRSAPAPEVTAASVAPGARP